MKTKSALSYFGSDSEVATQLAAKLDHCSHVTIPFVGGASILPCLKAKGIVANDLNDLAINFYRYASGVMGTIYQQQLIEHCQQTLSHPSELERAKRILDRPEASNLSKAWAYWAVCWIARKGKGGTSGDPGKPSVRRTAIGGNNASRITAAASDLPEWAKHFKRCEWESIDFRYLLPKVADKPNCGIYCDPPWVSAGLSYIHSFCERDHRDLAAELHRFDETAIVIRYDDHPLLHLLYSSASWDWTFLETRNQANKPTKEIWITRRTTQ